MENVWLNHLIGNIRGMGFSDYLDILVIAFLVYQLAKLVKETRAVQLLKGVSALILVYFLAVLLQLRTLRFIMESVLATGVVALVIVFQPELRRILEHVAQTKLGRFNIFQTSQEKDKKDVVAVGSCIATVCAATEYLSKSKTGALMVFERDTKLGEIIKTGTVIDSTPSTELIGNLFFVNTPLHDGAMIIRNGRLYAAGCFLPLSQNYTISKQMGTRHRAALGMSENSDAVVLIVSEETGTISIAQAGVIERNITISALEKRLRQELLGETEQPAEESGVKALLRKVKR